MVPVFYPTYLRERFTNRAHELAFLEGVAEDLRRGQPRHVAIFGLRRIGKTLLCQERRKEDRAFDEFRILVYSMWRNFSSKYRFRADEYNTIGLKRS